MGTSVLSSFGRSYLAHHFISWLVYIMGGGEGEVGLGVGF